MQNVVIAVDLDKDVFEIAVAKRRSGRIVERRRMTRAQFERFWSTREPCSVAMEACGSAHHWARHLIGLGYEVTLLPAKYVKPYRQRNKTDRADCEAILEAFRSPWIKPVAVKSQEQQAILALHRAREQWKDTRTMRINGIRGMLREFGIVAPKGADRFLARLPQLLESHRTRLPEAIRRLVHAYWAEAEELADWMEEIERELKGIAQAHPVMRTLLEIPGIGAITATALYAAIGNIHLFENGRQVASWLGLTPKGELERKSAPSGEDEQAGQRLSTHAVDPRRPFRAHCCAGTPEEGKAADQAGSMGAGEVHVASPLEPGGRRLSEQDGADRLGDLGARAAFRRQSRPAAQGGLSGSSF